MADLALSFPWSSTSPAHVAGERAGSVSAVAPYVLLTLFRATERVDLDLLVSAVHAPRALVRAAVTFLHEHGLVDALRMKLTPRGRDLGEALHRGRLPPARW